MLFPRPVNGERRLFYGSRVIRPSVRPGRFFVGPKYVCSVILGLGSPPLLPPLFFPGVPPAGQADDVWVGFGGSARSSVYLWHYTRVLVTW